MKINYAEKFKELVESEGYQLLSEYKNARTKVLIRCPEDHEYNVKPNNFKNGSRCPVCSNHCPIQAKEEFLKLVESVGYELIGEYKNVMTKVKIRCNKGHEYNVKPNNFKNGSRCPVCSNHCPIQAKEEFIELLTKEGYELLSEYKNATIKVKIRCNKGHIYNTKPNDFKSNCSRCPVCSNHCPIQAKEEFDLLVESVGYELLSEYKNTIIKVKIKCKRGHEYSVTPKDFKNGNRCPKCAGLCPIQAKEQFIELLTKEGYELLSEYKNNNTKVKLKCPEDHIWDTIPSSFKYNYVRCPHCAGSTGQRLLQEMLKIDINKKVIYNDRELLEGLELDIYYPDLNIAIEYQGNYWHNRPETKERDKRKRKICKEKDIKLIEVWDDDFLKNPDQILKETVYKIQEPPFFLIF